VKNFQLFERWNTLTLLSVTAMICERDEGSISRSWVCSITPKDVYGTFPSCIS
jgi:hypothetical protein